VTDINLHRRAEIAFRSLETRDRARVTAALDRIRTGGRDLHVKKLAGAGADPLYVYRASDALRVVFSRHGDTITVEDITNPEKIGSA
jgi:phage-related protein